MVSLQPNVETLEMIVRFNSDTTTVDELIANVGDIDEVSAWEMKN